MGPSHIHLFFALKKLRSPVEYDFLRVKLVYRVAVTEI